MLLIPTGLLFAAALPAWTHTDPFEPDNFDPTQALIDIGFDAAALPTVSAATGLHACHVAVSIGIYRRRISNRFNFHLRMSQTDKYLKCESLTRLHGPSRVLTPSSSSYDNFTSSYWSSLQSAVNPHCIFKPANALAVSSAVLISRITQCPFAAKSGGHAAFPGASSIEGGITISFEDMNKIEISEDKKVISIEPGNVWGSVYEYAHEHEVAVIGGRVHSVGTGGLTTGGISFPIS